MGKKLPSDILKYTVLKIFDEGPSYGYEVVSRIEEVTDGYWSPSYGTIYPLIQRMEEKGLLKQLNDEEADERGLEDGDRNYFELTEKGEKGIEPEKDVTDQRKKFEDLIVGYLKIYQNKYGEEALNDLMEGLK